VGIEDPSIGDHRVPLQRVTVDDAELLELWQSVGLAAAAAVTLLRARVSGQESRPTTG
jgi:hypothetical protein